MPVYNLFADDLTTTTPSDLQQAIVKLARSGIEEKWRLDFKQIWKPEQCTDIVALANTYGGLLVLGVSDDRLYFPGIEPLRNSDLKTQISSVIASNIAPVPLFEVHTCPAADNPENLLVLIRVFPQPRIHMYLKTDKPVYVRNEDGSKPATAVQLQALLERIRAAEAATPISIDPLGEVARGSYVTKADRKSGNRIRSETFLNLGIAPERRLGLALDVGMEEQFKNLIYETYPIAQRGSIDWGSLISDDEDRARSWYRYKFFNKERDHDMIWVWLLWNDGPGDGV